jgi:hypothetical protein
VDDGAPSTTLEAFAAIGLRDAEGVVEEAEHRFIEFAIASNPPN